MKDSVYTEKTAQAIHAVELFQLLSEEEQNQCLIYISALADRAMLKKESEEK